ncbi:MAG: hypothetical protein WBA04_08695, partial [Mycolicibacter algericus]
MRRRNSQPSHRRRARTAIGAVLAAGAIGGSFGLGPLSAAPSAHADADLDWLIDLFTPGVAADSDPLDSAAWFDQLFYDPLHASIQAWITSPFGEQINDGINQMLGSYVIGNGVDGTAENPHGGAGGLWFGDGGDGYDQSAAGVAG